ncbi:oxidoreductase [Spirosoma pomorum]
MIEQFINPNTNQRTDYYGGSIKNRCRFLMEIAWKTGEAIGFEKFGVRLSPYGAFNDMQAYPDLCLHRSGTESYRCGLPAPGQP